MEIGAPSVQWAYFPSFSTMVYNKDSKCNVTDYVDSNIESNPSEVWVWLLQMSQANMFFVAEKQPSLEKMWFPDPC